MKKIKKGQLLKRRVKPPIMFVTAVRDNHLILEEKYPRTTDAQIIVTPKELKAKYKTTSLFYLRVKKLLLFPLTFSKAIIHYFKDCRKQRSLKKK